MQLSSLFMVGLPADNDLSFVREFQPAGVILMGRNARAFSQIQQLTAQLRGVLERPLIASDHEGGRVQRLKDGFTILPPAREVASGGIEHVYRSGQLVGRELGQSGMNFNFAPICDVPIHKEDTVIGTRAFSTDFEEAGKYAAAYIKGLQESIGACAKHFPGHGGVGVDSHYGLPTFSGSYEELEPHLTPFRDAMRADVSAMMVAHIAVPCLDKTGFPSSLSKPVITDLLREEIGFRGLAVSDDLEMGALSDLGAGEIAVRAIEAGCDLLLFCHSPEKAVEGREAIEQAMAKGRLARGRVGNALWRIQQWKDRFAKGDVSSSNAC